MIIASVCNNSALNDIIFILHVSGEHMKTPDGKCLAGTLIPWLRKNLWPPWLPPWRRWSQTAWPAPSARSPPAAPPPPLSGKSAGTTRKCRQFNQSGRIHIADLIRSKKPLTSLTVRRSSTLYFSCRHIFKSLAQICKVGRSLQTCCFILTCYNST